jgi:hypothetical protein
MANNHDDDLTQHDGDETFEFEDSNDEFSVPDTPYGDDDNAFGSDEDLLGADDIDGGSVIDGDDEFSIGDDHSQDDHAEFAEMGYENESTDYTEEPMDEYDDQPAPAGLGWMAYAGIALAVVLTAGGMIMFMFPGDSGQSSAQRQPMDPARLQQIAQQNSGQSGNQGQQSQAQQPQNSQPQAPVQPSAQGEPVEVQAFPSGSQGDVSNNMGNGNGGSSNGGSVPPSNQPSSPIPDPNDDRSEYRDQGYEQVDQQRQMAMLDDQIEEVGSQYFVRKDEFSVLSPTVRKNRDNLDSLGRAFSSSKKEISDLERRVAQLEKASGGAVEAPKKELKPDPKVKDAQVVLKAYGYAPGPIDGLLGDRTKAAISRFQKAHDIDVTGNLDQATRKMLDGDVKENPHPVRRIAKSKASPKGGSHARASEKASGSWYIRGVTKTRAIVYKRDGTSYAVEHGTEIPGMGQVIAFYPQERQVETSKGMIGEL